MRILSPLCLCALLLGCGEPSYEGPKRIPISGTITYNDKPLEAGIVSFISQTEDQRPAQGFITNGQYSIPEEKGLNEGTYRVEIRWNRPTGKKILDSQDTGEMVEESKQVIPARYNTNSELTADVSKGNTTFNFDLKD
jgi:hypothetical protein